MPYPRSGSLCALRAVEWRAIHQWWWQICTRAAWLPFLLLPRGRGQALERARQQHIAAAMATTMFFGTEGTSGKVCEGVRVCACICCASACVCMCA